MGHGKEAVRKRLHNSLSSCVEVESETQPVLFAGQPLCNDTKDCLLI